MSQGVLSHKCQLLGVEAGWGGVCPGCVEEMLRMKLSEAESRATAAEAKVEEMRASLAVEQSKLVKTANILRITRKLHVIWSSVGSQVLRYGRHDESVEIDPDHVVPRLEWLLKDARAAERADVVAAIDRDIDFFGDPGRLSASEASLVVGVFRALRRDIEAGAHVGAAKKGSP
jgi:hypothetical protein